MVDNYIVIYQVKISNIGWRTESYFGPFESQSDARLWMKHPDNKLSNRSGQYVIEYLRKP